MPAWVAPATWVNGTLTAAFANAEVRDHLVWLKSALDLLTDGTIADTVGGTYLKVRRATTGDVALASDVSGDSANRFALFAVGTMQWGSGSAATDLRLFRSAAGRLDIDALGTPNVALLRVLADPTQAARVETWLTGDTQPRARLNAGLGALSGVYVGPGSSGPTKVVGERQTGWAAATGTATRTTFATGSVTLPQLAERVKALIDDLISHGLIGA